MTKVFFNIRTSKGLIVDKEGADFADTAEAKKEAEQALHEMLAEDIRSERPLNGRSIELTDSNGQILATVEINANVKLVQETGT